MRGLFITGTDTSVGKTVAASALLLRYRAIAPLRYWKPIQTGIEQDDDTAEVRRLAACNDDEIFDDGVRLPRPVSPHLAANWAGQVIHLNSLVEKIQTQSPSTRWIVEGAGGVLVPLNDSSLMADLMVRMGLPVLIVARTALGTINHTLLTLEALRARSLCVAGVLMVGDSNPGSRDAIEKYGSVRVIGEMPRFAPESSAPLASEALARWSASELDPGGHLLKFLQ